MVQVDVCLLCCRLVSRRCHMISTIQPLLPAPRRTGRGALHHPAPSLSPPRRLRIEVMNNLHSGKPTCNDCPERRPRHRTTLAAPVEPLTEKPASKIIICLQALHIPADSVVLDVPPKMILHIAHHDSAPFHSQVPQALIQQLQLLTKTPPLRLPVYHESPAAAQAHEVRES